MPKRYILVVDDNSDKRELLTLVLENAGFEVLPISNGMEALAAVEARVPDLIITDVNMPQIDGYEFVRRLRGDPKKRFIPIIMETAERKGPEDELLGAKAGALDYIRDFSDPELLIARVRILLEFKVHMDRCEKAALTDGLTGLPNRREFERELEREVARGLRHGRSFCVLLIDMDDFKKINDTYGHGGGDAALRRFADNLQSSKRDSDLVARFGGDEFGMILPETDLAGGVEASDRLLSAIRGSGMSASFGLARFPQDARSVLDLIRQADAALYKAKRGGKDRLGYHADAAEVFSGGAVLTQ